MMKIAHIFFSLLLLFTILFASASSLFLVHAQQQQQQQQQDQNNNPHNFTIVLSKGEVKVIDFGSLLSNYAAPGFTVVISESPSLGSVWALSRPVPRATIFPPENSLVYFKKRARRDRLRLLFTKPSSSNSGTSPRNIFLYQSSRVPATGNWDPYFTSLKFRFNSNAEGKIKTGILNIVVINHAPRIPPFVNRRAIDGRNTTSKIIVYDEDVELCTKGEISKVTILAGSTKNNSCEIRSVVSGKILGDNVTLSAVSGEFTITAFQKENNNDYSGGDDDSYYYGGGAGTGTAGGSNSNKIKRGGVCKFAYFATDISGWNSQIGFYNFINSKKEDMAKPRVFSRVVDYYPRKQHFVLIPLTAFTKTVHPAEHFMSFFLTSLPTEGSLHLFINNNIKQQQQQQSSTSTSSSVAAVSNTTDQLPPRIVDGDSPSNKISLLHPFKVYTGPLRRIHLLYRAPQQVSSSDTYFKEHFSKMPNVTFSWKAQLHGVDSNSATVTIRFRDQKLLVRDDTNNNKNNKDSNNNNNKNDHSKLRCGQSTYAPVFWNRVARRVRFNFSLASGDTVDEIRVVSVTSSSVQFGRLYQLPSRMHAVNKSSSTSAFSDSVFDVDKTGKHTKNPAKNKGKLFRVIAGSYITSDYRWPRLRFVPNPQVARKLGHVNDNKKDKNANQPWQEFSFKITTKMGATCLTKVRFILLPHESNSTIGTVFDTAPYSRWTLFALGGAASRNALFTSLNIDTAPVLGKLYAVKANLPYEANMTSQENLDPAMDAYCTRHNCEKYRGQRLKTGGVVHRLQLLSRSNFDVSKSRFWVLYHAPLLDPHPLADREQAQELDMFRVCFCRSNDGVSDCSDRLVEYNIFLKEGALRRIYVPFKPAPRIGNVGRQVTLVPIQLGNASLVKAAVLDFDAREVGGSRHGNEPEFKLLQAERNGADLVPTGPIDSKEDPKSHIRARWLSSPENYLLLVPNSQTQFHNFRFRARLYRKAVLARVSSIDEISRKSGDAFEDVRVIAVRQNTPPRWNVSNYDRTGWQIPLGEALQLSFEAIDDDDDLLTFVVLKPPQHADLFFEKLVFGKAFLSKPAFTGMKFRAPRGAVSEFRSTCWLTYRPRVEQHVPLRNYPLNDSFTIVADDGGAEQSGPLTVSLQVVLSKKMQDIVKLQIKKGNSNNNNRTSSSDLLVKTDPPSSPGGSAMGTIFIIVLVILVIGVAWILRRRWLIRAQYSKLMSGGAESVVHQNTSSTQDTEMT